MTDGHLGNALNELLKPKVEMEEVDGLAREFLCHTGLQLTHLRTVTMMFLANCMMCVQNVSKLHENNLIKFGNKILHGKMWLTGEKNLCIYGDGEINILCTHYNEMLAEKALHQMVYVKNGKT
ncbi:hypothetical protein PR048_019569 [Dryococelus australis]|uniref:Uncharacterized protein n=1 Tax=Dryococelus australis TaxID=614101 RepID=A0ABQ9H3X3_9NEOP|nr:hypothetical protein PR048_019569 [Dryococelus australis]